MIGTQFIFLSPPPPYFFFCSFFVVCRRCCGAIKGLENRDGLGWAWVFGLAGRPRGQA